MKTFWTGVLFLLLAGAAGAAQPASHPLDPLSPDEIRAASRALHAVKGFPEEAVFPIVALNDPPKAEILAYKGGSSFTRQVFAVVYGRKENKTFEALVDVKNPEKPKVDSWKQVPGVQPMALDEDGDRLDEAMRNDERWIKAVEARGLKPEDVTIDYWAAGTVPEQYKDRRVLRGLTYYQADAANFYGQPVEGLTALVDVNSGEVLEVTDTSSPKLPPPGQDFDEASVRESFGKLREAPKPLRITQPEGPSFVIRGNEVSWQKWRFRYLMHPREGLVLYLVSYEDKAGKPQPVLYRASFSEMAVPYGDPAGNWNWRCAFDVGEYGVGKSSGTIEPGTDAPENATLLDAVVASDEGRPLVYQDVVGLYERDGGMIWKHRETGGFQQNNESRRGRELVVFTIATVGNYDYSINWIFRQDGVIEVESGLSGIMLPKGVDDKVTHSHDPHGHLVTTRVVAPHHQHILNFRLDFDVYGSGNSVAELNTRSMPPGPDNPSGTAMIMEERVLPREKDAQRDLSLADARAWRVLNPTEKNSLGQERGYILVPGVNSVPYALEGALARRRAGFMDHHVWVTRYRPRELYAGGDYPNQSEGGDGLPRYASKNEPIENTDVVLWYTLNVTHIPRPEEWPVMPTTRVGFRLIPASFFEGNPALDVPR